MFEMDTYDQELPPAKRARTNRQLLKVTENIVETELNVDTSDTTRELIVCFCDNV